MVFHIWWNLDLREFDFCADLGIKTYFFILENLASPLKKYLQNLPQARDVSRNAFYRQVGLVEDLWLPGVGVVVTTEIKSNKKHLK